mgnify:CR=1 FL=1
MSKLSETQAFNDVESDLEYSSKCEKLCPDEQEEQDQASKPQVFTLIEEEPF